MKSSTTGNAEINIGISTEDRKTIAESLSHLLADTYMLYLKTHNFHWNVTGPMFSTLHLMFESQYNEVWLAVDEIAERMRSIGFFAPGTTKDFGKLATIGETDGLPHWKEMVRHLMIDNESVIRVARKVFTAAQKSGDEATCDLINRRVQAHEKAAWMLRSIIQE